MSSPPLQPTSAWATPLLTDMYQISMAYSFWVDGRADDHAVFDIFFRKAPFAGEFTVFAGLEECVRVAQCFRFDDAAIAYLRGVLPTADAAFWPWLAALDCSALRIYAIAEGTVVFPRVPLMRIEGPLAACQLLETVFLNLLNFASLITTNAARHRLAVGPSKQILEFGLRRAQGPDGAMSASRYAYMGGCDGTSNVAAGAAFGIEPRGTHAHSLVSAYASLDDLSSRLIDGRDVVDMAMRYRRELAFTTSSLGELAAFISFARAFPDNFLALVDTYDTLGSGVPNYICVALALQELGHKPRGIRLDSGDLAYLSREARRMFREVDARYGAPCALGASTIVASNDLNEAVLLSLTEQGHEIDVFGIGTNLVTCQAQPALGMVCKLVEINGLPRIKISQDFGKVTLPGAKEAFRLIGSEGVPLLDLLILAGEARPQPNVRLLCRHPFDEKKRVYVTPSVVIPLLRLVWQGAAAGVREERIESRRRHAPAPAAVLAAALFESLAPGRDFKAGGDEQAGAVAGGGGVGEGSGTDSRSGSGSPRSTAGEFFHAATPAAVGVGASRAATAAAVAHSPPLADSASTGGAAGGGNERVGLVRSASVSTGELRVPSPSLQELRAFVGAQIALMRADHMRPLNPTPYKVSVSADLFSAVSSMLLKELPIPELG